MQTHMSSGLVFKWFSAALVRCQSVTLIKKDGTPIRSGGPQAAKSEPATPGVECAKVLYSPLPQHGPIFQKLPLLEAFRILPLGLKGLGAGDIMAVYVSGG